MRTVDVEKTSLKDVLADFGWNLFRTVSKGEQNVFLSPASISMALAMTYAGSDTTTNKEMNQVMFGGMKENVIHEGFKELCGLLNPGQKALYELHSANRLYVHQRYPPLADFLKFLKTNYNSGMFPVDFGTKPDKVAEEINSWVNEVTKGKITDIIEKGKLNDDTRLVLVNAIYFKGNWMKQFNKHATTKKPFYSTPNKEIKVDMMSQVTFLPYFCDNDVEVLGMHYKGEEIGRAHV